MEPYATAEQVWAGGLIFARVGAILMLLPGVGESYVPPLVRLSLALVLSLALWPIVASSVPALPATLGATVGRVILGGVTGHVIGTIRRGPMAVMNPASAGRTRG